MESRKAEVQAKGKEAAAVWERWKGEELKRGECEEEVRQMN